ncbi:MAG: PP2C family protein-serine/threonine phosphatase [Planctomycetota bacterium]
MNGALASAEVSYLNEMMGALRAARDADTAHEVFRAALRGVFPGTGYLVLATDGLAPGEYRVAFHVGYDGRASEAGNGTVQGDLLAGLIANDVPQIFLDCNELDGGLAKYCSGMAVPVREDRWAVLLHRRREAFQDSHLEQFVLRANLLGSVLERLDAQAKLRATLDQSHVEIERIGAIQKALLPESLPDIPGVEIDVSYATFDRAGGDFYFLPRARDEAGERVWTILVGDVSGHGPAAAVVMAMVESMMALYPHDDPSPARLLDYLNGHLCRKRIERSFVTAAAATYDPARRHLTYACAGHPPVLWQRRGDNGQVSVQKLADCGGIPLGVMPDTEYGNAAVELAAGDTLAFYTDGIVEARDPAGGFFGVDGLQRAMSDCEGDVYCVVESVMQILKRHEQGGRPDDDQTLLALQIVQ